METNCEYCGPVCYRGAAHNARVEDGEKWSNEPKDKPPAPAEPPAQAVAAGQGGHIFALQCVFCGTDAELPCPVKCPGRKPSAPPQPTPPQASAGAETDWRNVSDSKVLGHIQNTNYARDAIARHLMNMTGDQKSSLYRAIIAIATRKSLAQPATPEPDWRKIARQLYCAFGNVLHGPPITKEQGAALARYQEATNANNHTAEPDPRDVEIKILRAKLRAAGIE